MEHKSASTLEKKIRFGQSTKLFRLDNKVEDLWKDHSSGDELDSVKHGKDSVNHMVTGMSNA